MYSCGLEALTAAADDAATTTSSYDATGFHAYEQYAPPSAFDFEKKQRKRQRGGRPAKMSATPATATATASDGWEAAAGTATAVIVSSTTTAGSMHPPPPPAANPDAPVRRCMACGTTETPKWRCSMTLCNACGLRNAKRVGPIRTVGTP